MTTTTFFFLFSFQIGYTRLSLRPNPSPAEDRCTFFGRHPRPQRISLTSHDLINIVGVKSGRVRKTLQIRLLFLEDAAMTPGRPREPEVWVVIEAVQVHCYLALPVYALHGLASAQSRSLTHIITRERSRLTSASFVPHRKLCFYKFRLDLVSKPFLRYWGNLGKTVLVAVGCDPSAP